jgi:hypothetical protein
MFPGTIKEIFKNCCDASKNLLRILILLEKLLNFTVQKLNIFNPFKYSYLVD